MPRTTKRRSYDSSSRKQAALATRQAILDAARRLFLKHGYATATMPAIAHAAGIALDTVYAAVGRKPKLFRLLIETAISGQPEVIPAEARDYVQAIRAESDPAEKLRIYARALGAIQPRLAPLFRLLQSAAELEPELKKLWTDIARRRATNMQLLAENLHSTGRLRHDLSLTKAADILWSMNSPELYLLLVSQRRWTAEEYQQWLAEAWIALLLES